MSESKPEQSIGFLISDVSRLLRRNFDKRAQKIGLSRAQWQVLAWLKRNEGISQTQRADLLEMSPMTLVRLIDRLEMNGLVERRAHPTDRRIYQLFLAGHAIRASTGSGPWAPRPSARPCPASRPRRRPS